MNRKLVAITENLSQAKKYAHEARFYLGAGKYIEAINAYTQAIQHPTETRDKARYYCNRGLAKVNLNDLDGAVKSGKYQDVFYYNRAKTLSRLGNYKLASDYFLSAISLSQLGHCKYREEFDVAEVYSAYGVSMFRQNNFDKAILAFKIALEWDPTRIVDQYYIAVAYYNNLEFYNAIQHSRIIFELETDKKAALLMIAQSHLALNQHAEAINVFSKLLEIDPTDEIIMSLLIKSYEKCERCVEAKNARKLLERMKSWSNR